ncbi:hypothetical protein GCM10011415_37530 [Salipiger pallidus]|uniref:Uncharacterized protein n=1 Tax=Salipiger pallidus TaxID=1775170 RepID=A0A8J3EIZ5_9RHOB|nr:hypothetical protein [Salipiger pallidus]GGG83989.1 hypothetical protein GCM10011415_37530 [Salipiger pallidus]
MRVTGQNGATGNENRLAEYDGPSLPQSAFNLSARRSSKRDTWSPLPIPDPSSPNIGISEKRDRRPTAGEQKFGPDLERPRGDDRSAEEIVKDNPTLAQLHIKDKNDLAKKLGKKDWNDLMKDPDAAYKASAVINHIENYNDDGDVIEGKKVGDGRIDGWTRANRNDKKSEAKHGTEAGRFQDFIKYGFDHFNHKSPVGGDGIPRGDQAANGLDRFTTRPEGDTRSAEEIKADSPLLTNLGDSERERLKQKVGDFDRDPDAAYRAVSVLEMIENYDGDGKALYGDKTENDRIDGYHYNPNASEVFLPWKWGKKKRKTHGGSEAARLEEFLKNGFDAFDKDIPITGRPIDGEAESGLNHDTKRPKGDKRSADEIIDDNPILAQLSKREKHALKQMVGDFENDPDAAFRAVAVLNHIEHFDAEGNEIFDKSVGDGRVSGFRKGKDAKGGSEAKRLETFFKEGYGSLKGDAEIDGTYKGNEAEGGLSKTTKRPEGDTRSADQILDDNPELKSLPKKYKDDLKKHVGDFERDPDAAYRAASVLNHIRNFDENGSFVPSSSNRRSGWFADVTSWPNELKNRLEDFGKYGFKTLQGKDANEHGMKKDVPPPRHTTFHGTIGPETTRPYGDTRSADEIVKDNPILAQLSTKDKQALKRRVGDFERDPAAAFRAVAVLNHIENFSADGERLSGKDVGNGRIEGWTRADRNDPKSQAKNGTEAGRFQDFIDHGYGTLKGHSEIDGIPAGLDRRDVPRPGVADYGDLPKSPLSLDEREKILEEGRKELDGELSKAKDGSKAKTLHNLIHMLVNADEGKFKGKIDKKKIQEDIAELLNDPEIIAIQEKIETKIAKKVTGKSGDEIVSEVEDILNDPEVQEKLDTMEPAERQRYVKGLIDTVALFDQGKANELRGKEVKNQLETAIDPEQLKNMTDAEISEYVDSMVAKGLSISRITNGTASSFINTFNEIPAAGKGQAKKALVLLLKNVKDTGNMTAEEMVSFLEKNGIKASEIGGMKKFLQKLDDSKGLTVLGSLMAGAHFITRFTNGGSDTTPWDRLTMAADVFSATGQMAGTENFWKMFGMSKEGKSLASATQTFYGEFEEHGGKVPANMSDGRPPSPVELAELRHNAPSEADRKEIEKAIDEYFETLEELAPDAETKAFIAETRELIAGASPEDLEALEEIGDEFADAFIYTADEAGIDADELLHMESDGRMPGLDTIPEEVRGSDYATDVNEALDASGVREELDLPRLTDAEVLNDPTALNEQIAQVMEEGDPETVAKFLGFIPKEGLGMFLKVVGTLSPIGDLLYAAGTYHSAVDNFAAGKNEKGVLDLLGGTGLAMSGGFGLTAAIGDLAGIAALSGPLFPLMAGFGLAVTLVTIIGQTAMAGQEKAKAEHELDDLFKGGAGNDKDYYLA